MFAQCKQRQEAYVKTYLNMQCNGKFGCALRNITSNLLVVKHWASWSFPDENPPSRKEIIYCIGESIKISLLTLRRMHWWLIPCVNIVFQYSLSAINRLIACLHFRVQRDYKMPEIWELQGTPEDCIQIWIIIATGQRNWLLECFIEMLRGERGLEPVLSFPHFILILKPWPKTSS